MENGTPVAASLLESKRIGGQNETTSRIYPGDDLSSAVYSSVMEGTKPERERKITQPAARDLWPDSSSVAAT